jgi:hypothetical protein
MSQVGDRAGAPWDVLALLLPFEGDLDLPVNDEVEEHFTQQHADLGLVGEQRIPPVSRSVRCRRSL